MSVRILLIFVALITICSLSTGSSRNAMGKPVGISLIPGTVATGGGQNPECIDMSGIDQALEELMMCLRGRSVKTITAELGMLEVEDNIVTSPEMFGFPLSQIEPALQLQSLIENGPSMKLRKVLVDRERTSAYFDDPQVFAFTNDGHLIYIDAKSGSVRILNDDGTLKCEFGGYGPEAGNFDAPSALSADVYNRIFVADKERGDIQVFKDTGEYTGVLATGLREPVAMACFNNVELFVIERETATVRVFSITEMREIRTFGGVGDKPGRYRSPSSIAITKLGSLVIADSGNDRIQIVDRRGKVEQVWDNIRFPQYVATDQLNYVYILADTIRKTTSNGSPVGEWSRALQFEDGTRYFLGNGIYPGLTNTVFINDNLYGNILVYETK